MFIWLTNPTIGQVLVNLNLVTAVTCVQGRNTVCFTGGEEDYIVVTESLEDIYERIQSADMKEWWQMEMKILNELAGMLEDINPNEIVSHILDGTLLSWLASWKMKSQMLVAFLLENEKARLSEKD